MNKNYLLFLFIISFSIGILIFVSLPKTKIIATHNIILEKNLSDLISESNVIIKGKIGNKLPSRWTNPDFIRGDHIRNIIQTDTNISIIEVLKGVPYNNSSLNLRTDTGKLDNVEYISEDIPALIYNEEVILFLSKDDSDVANPAENYYVLTGMGQGLYIKEPYADSLYTCFYDQENQNIIEESVFKDMIATSN
jgi:hypothetical protein